MSGLSSPCPECGAGKGKPHAKTCSRGTKQRKTPCPPHEPEQTGRPDPEGKYRHRCKKCKQQVGVW